MVARAGDVHFRVFYTCADIKQGEVRLRGDQVLRFSWRGRFHSDLYFFQSLGNPRRTSVSTSS
jgi:hypothetical protein